MMEFTRIKNDVNGNGRLVCHFLSLNTTNELASLMDVSVKYAKALARAKKIGGRRFHNRQFGGGIVFTNYESVLEADILRVVAAAEARGE